MVKQINNASIMIIITITILIQIIIMTIKFTATVIIQKKEHNRPTKQIPLFRNHNP